MSLEFTLAAVASVLNNHDAEWAVMGGHASNLYRSEVRGTMDVDILVSLNEPQLTGLLPDLEAAGWKTRHMTADGWLVRLDHPKFGPIDIMLVQEAYQRTALARCETYTMEEAGKVRFLAVEDVLIHKLIADRYQDNADVVSILKSRPQLDDDYMKTWSERWEVEDRYRLLRNQALRELSEEQRLKQSDS